MPSPGAAVTPYRIHSITFDPNEPVTTAQAWESYRAGKDITPYPGTSGMRQLSTGSWTPSQVQSSVNSVRELTTYPNAIIPNSDYVFPQVNLPGGGTADLMTPRNTYAPPSDLPNATLGASGGLANAPQDPFLFKQIPAGQDWNNTDDDDITAFGQPTLSTQNIVMDRIAMGTQTYDPGTGFMVRWISPNQWASGPDTLHTFYFGGPLYRDGGGEWCLAIGGDGFAHLFQRVPTGTGFDWVNVDNWQYAQQTQAAQYQSMMIQPILGNPPSIDFLHGPNSSSDGVGGIVSGYLNRPTLPQSHNYNLFGLAATIAYLGLSSALLSRLRQDLQALEVPTGAGPIRHDMRRDLRIPIQASTLNYPASASLVDGPIYLPNYPATGSIVTIWYQATIPDGCGMTISVVDAVTQSPLTPESSGDGFADFEIADSATVSIQVTFTFTCSPTLAPVLDGYKATMDGVITTLSNSQWTAVARKAQVVGPEADPSHENSTIEIEDATAVLTNLQERGSIRYRLSTSYNPANPSQQCVLSDGYIQRANAHRRGIIGATQGWAGYALRQYPSPYWTRYTLIGIGMWQRLTEMSAPERILLADGGSFRKVTDVVRQLIQFCGFSNDQIDVPDLPQQFWPSPGDQTSGILVDLFANCGELIVKFVTDYLGYFIIWDGNANTGMWRVLPYPNAPYTPIYTFMTQPPPGKAVHSPFSYPANTSLVQKDSLETYVKAPEGNVVQVVGIDPSQGKQIRATLVNTNSYAFNSDVPPSPNNNPDYLGRLVPITIVDPALFGQDAVNWVCRRTFGVACHAIQFAAWTSPLVLYADVNAVVMDPNNSLFGQNPYLLSDGSYRPRPLRFGDVVQVNTAGSLQTLLIRNCNPSLESKDWKQMCAIEAMIPPDLEVEADE